MNSDSVAYVRQLTLALESYPHAEVAELVTLLGEAKKDGRFIFVMGNGGSGATASHWVCDMNKGASYGHPLRYKMLCLNDNFPTVMAYSNDVSYAVIFEEQLRNLLSPGDLVIGISGSGNSPNVVRAIEYANANGGKTIGMTGYSGGALKEKAQHSIHFPVHDMQLVEDLHMMTAHVCMQASCAVPPPPISKLMQ